MLGTTATGCVVSDGNSDATLLVTNQSDYIIDELYVAPVGTRTWGRNLLGNDGLFPDEEILLQVQCDFYDARLVDENGEECIVPNLDLCANDADWVLTNDICGSIFNAFAAKREAAEQAAQASITPAVAN